LDEGASPASNGGRGLKRIRRLVRGLIRQSIARQQWRARIETRNTRLLSRPSSASPASNGGPGLKHRLMSQEVV